MTNPILSVTASALGKVQQWKPMNKLTNTFTKNPEKTLAGIAVTSIIIKDGVGCYKYVTQSLKNDKIPEQKRKFVAALDLTNGLLMIVSQVGMFYIMRKCSEPLFKKIFSKSFNEVTKKNTISRLRMMYEKANQTPPRPAVARTEFENSTKKTALDLFQFVADIGAATIIGKRVIVPLIATPLAQKVEKKMGKGKTNEPQQEVQNTAFEGQKLNIVSTSDTNLLSKFKKA